MRLLLTLGALVLLAAACSNGGSEEEGRILALPGADVSESDYRNLVRTLVARGNAIGVCLSIQELSDNEIVDDLIDPEGQSEALPTPEANRADTLFAATILREECDRILDAETSPTSTTEASPTPVATPPDG